MPHPLIGTLPCPTDRGHLKVTAELAVPDWPGVWALGDCVVVPDLSNGKVCPPTAQHALRQGKVVAQNILAYAEGGEFKQFNFKTIGQLASIGHRCGQAGRKGHGSLVAKKSEVDEREERLAAGGETGCDLYYLCVELATAQNPPHLPILLGFWSSAGLASA